MPSKQKDNQFTISRSESLARRDKSPLMIALGVIIWSLTMIKSGLIYSFGMGFWGANGHDGVWHISLAGSLSRGSSQMPIFSGEVIQNYHLGFDYLLAILHLITHIDLSLLYFQILPPLLGIFIGFSAYLMLRAWDSNRPFRYWGLFYLFFGGSLGWLVSFLKGTGFGGESMFWSTQSISTLINPPYALSLGIIFLGCYFLNRAYSLHRWKYILISGLLFGLLFQIKIYAGLLSLAALFVVLVWSRSKIVFQIFLISLAFFIAAFALSNNSTSLIVFRPFWFVETMLAVSDRFPWTRLISAINAYREQGIYPKLIAALGLGTVIFLIGNFGTRVIGLLHLLRVKKIQLVDIFWAAILVAGIAVPMMFVQSGTPWNTIQFFYYSQIALGFFAARVIADNLGKFSNRMLSLFLTALVVGLTLPTTLEALQHYLPSTPPAKISREEISALRVLRSLPVGVVFTVPMQVNPYAPAPRSLYEYESTAYVSAFSGKSVFLEDTVNLNITGYDWPLRRDLSQKFMVQTDASQAKDFLRQYQIRYIYIPKIATTRPLLSATQLSGKEIYENSQVAIWEVLSD